MLTGPSIHLKILVNPTCGRIQMAGGVSSPAPKLKPKSVGDINTAPCHHVFAI